MYESGVYESGVYESGVYESGVYVAGESGASHFDIFEPANATSAAFLARFEREAATLTPVAPRIFPDCVVNAASYVGGGVAPGEIVAIFGMGTGPAELVRARVEGRGLATTLSNTRVLFSGVPAPILYVSHNQTAAIVPYAVAGRSSVDVEIEYTGVRSDALSVPVLASRPGIFSVDGSGRGQAVILNQDGSLNSRSNPAPRGTVISIFATGGGESAEGLLAGEIVNDTQLKTALPVVAAFLGARGWTTGDVLYAGGVPGAIAGLLQMNVRVPLDVIEGDAVAIAVVIGSQWTAVEVSVALR